MNCRICNSAPDSRGYCPNCGFDEGLAYEYYPTLQQLDGLSLSGRRKNWVERNSAQKSETIPSSKDHVSSAQSKKSISTSRILTIIIAACNIIEGVIGAAQLWAENTIGEVFFVEIIFVAPAIVVLLSLKKNSSKTINWLSFSCLLLIIFSWISTFLILFSQPFLDYLDSIPALTALTESSDGFLETALLLLLLVIMWAIFKISYIITRKLTVANTSDIVSEQKKD